MDAFTLGLAMDGVGSFAHACALLATAWLRVALGGYREMLRVLAAVGTAAVAAFAMVRKLRG